MQLGSIPVPSLGFTPQSPYIPMVRPHVYSAHCWQRPPGIIPLRPRYFPRGNKPRLPPWPQNGINQHHRMQPRMNWYLPVNVTSPRQNMGYPRQCGRLRGKNHSATNRRIVDLVDVLEQCIVGGKFTFQSNRPLFSVFFLQVFVCVYPSPSSDVFCNFCIWIKSCVYLQIGNPYFKFQNQLSLF